MISRLIKIDKTVRHAVEQADVVLVKKKTERKGKNVYDKYTSYHVKGSATYFDIPYYFFRTKVFVVTECFSLSLSLSSFFVYLI